MLFGLVLLALTLAAGSALAFDDGSLCMSVQNGQHDWRYQSGTEATCTSTGIAYYKCRNCNKEASETLPMTEHAYNWTETQAPTCGAPGTETQVCVYCGGWGDKRDIPATGNHSFEWQPVGTPTCTASGVDAQSVPYAGPGAIPGT